MDARTGDVLAWVGGRDSGQSHFDRVAGAPTAGGQRVQAVRLRGGARSRLRAQPAARWTSRCALALQDGKRLGAEELRRQLRGPRDACATRWCARRTSPRCAWRKRSAVAQVASAGGARGHRRRRSPQPSMALGTVAVRPLELDRRLHRLRRARRCARRRAWSCASRRRTAAVLWRSEPARAAVLDAGVAFLVTDALRDALERGSGAPVCRRGLPRCRRRQDRHDQRRHRRLVRRLHAGLAAAVWIGFDEPRPIVARRDRRPAGRAGLGAADGGRGPLERVLGRLADAGSASSSATWIPGAGSS